MTVTRGVDSQKDCSPHATNEKNKFKNVRRYKKRFYSHYQRLTIHLTLVPIPRIDVQIR